MVRKKLRQTTVREGMLEQPFDRTEGTCHDIGSDFSTINNVHGMPDTGCQDFCIEHVVVIDPTDLLNQLRSELNGQAYILIKGSRFMQMNLFCEALISD